MFHEPANPFSAGYPAPGVEFGHVGVDDGTYQDFDFVARKKSTPPLRTVVLVAVLVFVIAAAGVYYLTKGKSSPRTAVPKTVQPTTTTVPAVFATAKPFSDPSSEFTATFPGSPTASQTQSNVAIAEGAALQMPSTTYTTSATFGSASYSYQVVVLPLPSSMTGPQSLGGGKYTLLSVVQGLEPKLDATTLKSGPTMGTAGPGNAWLTGDFTIQVAQDQFLVGRAELVGSVAFVVDVRGPSDQPPGYQFFVDHFSPGRAATATVQEAASPSSTG